MRAAALLTCVVLACGSSDDKPAGEKWPARPANGAPVAIELVDVTGPGAPLEARMRVFNFGDQAITKIDSTLEYFDGSGKKVQEFPWSWAGASLVPAHASKDKKVGAAMPEGARKVT